MDAVLAVLFAQHQLLCGECKRLEEIKDFAALSYCTAAKNNLHKAIDYLVQGTHIHDTV